MSENTILLLLGIGLLVIGLVKINFGHRSHSSLKNIGININSRNDQRIASVEGQAANRKSDWMGLAISAIGLLTALAGLFKG